MAMSNAQMHGQQPPVAGVSMEADGQVENAPVDMSSACEMAQSNSEGHYARNAAQIGMRVNTSGT